MYPFYCYIKCGTCRKARKFLTDHEIKFDEIDIKSVQLKPEDIKEFHLKSGKPIKRLFNTSGNLYKELKLKDKVNLMSDAECYALLATDGMLLKRPILVTDNKVYIGFKEEEYKELIHG